jgi:hypothetical protein
VQATCCRQLRLVSPDDRVETLDPHILIAAGEFVVWHVVEHSLDEVGGRYFVREEALLDHRVAHVLEDPNHALKVLVRCLVLRRAVFGVLLGEVFDAGAVDVERHAIMAAVQARLVGIVAPEFLAD